MHTLGVQFFFRRLLRFFPSPELIPQTTAQFPIINSTHHLLPSPHGELAPAIEAILDVYGTEVTVVVSHNGQGISSIDFPSWDRTQLDRRARCIGS